MAGVSLTSFSVASTLDGLRGPLVGVGHLIRAEGAVVKLELTDCGQACPDGEFLPGRVSQPGAVSHPGLSGRSCYLRVKVRGH